MLLLLSLFLGSAVCWAVAPEDYFNAGKDLYDHKDYEKAVKYFHAAVEQRPDYWQAYQLLGQSYYQVANRTEAILAIDESLRLHPNNPELRKFEAKIRAASPWVSKDFVSRTLPILSILISLGTLAWTLWGQRWWRSRKAPAP
ncbi:MAG TPA: tetratricopeptide repeat protein [bacterium]|nr:tetratricopeptide repeat protein [bacterium]